MRAARIISPSPDTGGAVQVASLAAEVGEAIAIRVASEHDAAAASPVHAMHARLARSLRRRSRRRSRRAFDPVRVVVAILLAAYTVGAWWGLMKLGTLLVRHWTAH